MNRFSLLATELNTTVWEVIHLRSIDSTNNYAKNNLQKFQCPTLIVADHQTAGRGRGSHAWDDNGNGAQFLSTWIIPMGNQKPDPKWTMAIGYKTFKALKDTWPALGFSMKAPNDIFLNDQKLAGLLIESVMDDGKLFVIVGLGINIFSCPSEHSSTGTFLAASCGSQLNEKSWNDFMKRLSDEYSSLDQFVSNPQWLQTIKPAVIEALNANPLQKNNPIRNITEDGSLELHQGYLNWLEL